jgi:hypothetical protein
VYDDTDATEESADLVSIAPGKTEFLDELSLQFLEDKTGSYQLMV